MILVVTLLTIGPQIFRSFTNFSMGVEPFTLAMGDVNSDGKLDLITANNGAGTVLTLLGTGNGSFSTATNDLVSGAIYC